MRSGGCTAPATSSSRRTIPTGRGTLERALAAGAEDRSLLRERDTCFALAHGRLKPRAEEPGGATLIAYERPDVAAERVSEYRLVPVAEPESLRAALAGANGIAAVVVKRRHLLIWESVRIHLDEVGGLGSTWSSRRSSSPGSDLGRERAQVAELRLALDIRDENLREGSYAADAADGARTGAGAARIARKLPKGTTFPSATRGRLARARPRDVSAIQRLRPRLAGACTSAVSHLRLFAAAVACPA